MSLPSVIVSLLVLLMLAIGACIYFTWENKRHPCDKTCSKCRSLCNYLTEGDICQDCADDEAGHPKY